MSQKSEEGGCGDRVMYRCASEIRQYRILTRCTVPQDTAWKPHLGKIVDGFGQETREQTQPSKGEPLAIPVGWFLTTVKLVNCQADFGNIWTPRSVLLCAFLSSSSSLSSSLNAHLQSFYCSITVNKEQRLSEAPARHAGTCSEFSG